MGYFSLQEPRRLVVFVHGWKGKILDTWTGFQPPLLRDDSWWNEADLLFAGYDWKVDEPSAIAADLFIDLDTYYPKRPEYVSEVAGVRLPSADGARYEELYLVGHSLGGLVLRVGLLATYKRREDDPVGARMLDALEARLRLFSPAIAGAVPTGWKGRANAVFRKLFELYYGGGASYHRLQPGTPLLTATRDQTIARQRNPDASALVADVLWARPEDLVEPTAYDHDREEWAPFKSQTHTTVCKPSEDNPAPWNFVETGHQ